MHRTLHENKFLYKYIHGLHHKYNKPSTLSPWASVAFNPIDGILQVRASQTEPKDCARLTWRESLGLLRLGRGGEGQPRLPATRSSAQQQSPHVHMEDCAPRLYTEDPDSLFLCPR